jgi:hypothetical protein
MCIGREGTVNCLYRYLHKSKREEISLIVFFRLLRRDL